MKTKARQIFEDLPFPQVVIIGGWRLTVSFSPACAPAAASSGFASLKLRESKQAFHFSPACAPAEASSGKLLSFHSDPPCPQHQLPIT